jgi:hypothetical protein
MRVIPFQSWTGMIVTGLNAKMWSVSPSIEPLLLMTLMCRQANSADRKSGKETALLLLPPLRTGHDSFPSSGSSLNKASFRKPVTQLTYRC